jgi:hypothetical protein
MSVPPKPAPPTGGQSWLGTGGGMGLPSTSSAPTTDILAPTRRDRRGEWDLEGGLKLQVRRRDVLGGLIHEYEPAA